MNNTNPVRLYVLIALTVLSAIFFIITIIPNSPFEAKNVCMNTELAKSKYASNNVSARKDFIEKRNEDCKELLKYAEPPKSQYDKLDNCNMLDSVVDASNHYMDLHKRDKSVVREELKYLSKYLSNYNYCPQYASVVKDVKAREASSR